MSKVEKFIFLLPSFLLRRLKKLRQVASIIERVQAEKEAEAEVAV